MSDRPADALRKESVTLTQSQWDWLRRLSLQTQSRSKSAELRRLIEEKRAEARIHVATEMATEELVA